MKKVFLSLFIVVFLTSSTFAQDVISFDKQGYYPEGIAYYKTEKVFLLGSMTQGEIGALDKSGNLKTFITDEAIISPIGIKVNEEKQLLYVANSDIGVSKKTVKTGQGKTAQLLVYDLKTKKRVAKYDLAKISGEGYFFANDLTYDNKGDIYITNSFGGHIWKIDTNGKASIFTTHDFFKVDANHFGLNGIVYHPKGYLIVAHYAKGKLYKIPVKDPKNVSEIRLSFTPIGADGLELIDNNTLLVIANNSDAVKLNSGYTLSSNNDWTSARTSKINAFDDAFPTTTTKVGSKVYTLYASLDKMLSGVKPSVKTFKVLRVKY